MLVIITLKIYNLKLQCFRVWRLRFIAYFSYKSEFKFTMQCTFKVIINWSYYLVIYLLNLNTSPILFLPFSLLLSSPHSKYFSCDFFNLNFHKVRQFPAFVSSIPGSGEICVRRINTAECSQKVHFMNIAGKKRNSFEREKLQLI